MTEHPLEEGWYLMSSSDLERRLRALREDTAASGPSDGLRLSVPAALRYRDAGNVPDARGRSLRLILDPRAPGGLEARRLVYEPDFHEAPSWRREGSKPVNVVPLQPVATTANDAWWEDPEMAAMESEWRRTGSVGELRVPGQYRSFVFKTVAALRRGGKRVTPDSVAGSIERWLAPADAAALRAALVAANDPSEPRAGAAPLPE